LSVVVTYAASADSMAVLVPQRVLHRLCRRVAQPQYDVGAGVQRDGYRRVTRYLLGDLRVHALREQERRAGVPQVVKPRVAPFSLAAPLALACSAEGATVVSMLNVLAVIYFHPPGPTLQR
jgi:hypothetical protein